VGLCVVLCWKRACDWPIALFPLSIYKGLAQWNNPSRKTSISSASSEIPRILCNQLIAVSKNRPPRVPVQSQINPLHVFPTYIFTLEYGTNMLRSSLFWDIPPGIVVIPYRRFGKTFKGQLIQEVSWIYLPIGYLETSARNYCDTMCCIPEESRSHLLRGGSLISRNQLFLRNVGTKLPTYSA